MKSAVTYAPPPPTHTHSLTALGQEVLSALANFSNATPEEVLEALRTYASYTDYLPERPDLAPHLEKFATDMASMALSAKNAEILKEDDGISVLTASMKKIADAEECDGREAILEQSGLALHRITGKKAVYHGSANKGAVANLLDTLRKHPKFAKLAEYTLGCLADLAKNEQNLKEIIAQGGTELLMEILKANPDNEELQLMGKRLLAKIASTPEGAAAIAKLGGAALVVDDLQRQIQNAALTRLNMAVLSNLANLEEVVAELNELGGIDSIIGAMKMHVGDPEIALAALSLLSKMELSAEDIEKIKSMGGIEAIMATMNAHAYNANVIAAGALALGKLAEKGDVDAAMAAIKEAMEVSNFTALNEALETLANLCLVEELRDYAVKASATELVVEVYEMDNLTENVKASAIRCLGCMAVNGKASKILQRKGMVESTIDLLRADPANLLVVRPCVFFLGQLGMSGSAATKRVIGAKGIRAIVEAMWVALDPVMNETLLPCAFRSLGLLFDEAGEKAPFEEEGCLSALSDICKRSAETGDSVRAITIDALKLCEKLTTEEDLWCVWGWSQGGGCGGGGSHQ